MKTGHKLLIVGDAPYAHEYIQDLRARAASDPRIIFTGFVFGESYRALQQNAYCYVHATEVGGRIRRFGSDGIGNCVLTLAAPENVETVGDATLTYENEAELARKLEGVLGDAALVGQYRQRAQLRVRERYTWEHVVDRYEELFAQMAGLSIRQNLALTRAVHQANE